MPLPKFCQKILGTIIDAGFSRILLPKQTYIVSRGLATLHKFLLLCIVGMVSYLLMNNPTLYMAIKVPTGFPRLTLATHSGYANQVTNELTHQGGADFCDSSKNNKYAFAAEGEKYRDFSCVDSDKLGDDAADVGVGQIFLPLSFQEDFKETATEAGACTTLSTACGAADGPTDYDDGTAGASKFTAAANGRPCTCHQIPQSYFTTGATKKVVEVNHMMSVESPSLVSQSSYAHKTDSEHKTAEVASLMTKIMTYDSVGQVWKEGSCPSSTASQDGDECRFNDGDVPSMSVQDWLNIANISSLDSPNAESGMQTNTWTTYSTKTTNSHPTWRITGLELVLQLEYVDSGFHEDTTWKDPYSGTRKRFPGVMCFAKVQVNPVENTIRKLDAATITPLSSGSGKVRRRKISGLSFSFTNSTESKRGYISTAALASYLATTIVFVKAALLAVMSVALYTLGNTSRNYKRCLRDQVNVAVQSAQRTPAKLINAAVSFFMMREWEHDKDAMHKFLDDQTTVHESTIKKFLRTAFNPDMLPDVDEAEVDDMVDAAWHEMTHGSEGLTLMEFLDAFLSAEVVDFTSMRSAYDTPEEKGKMERVFGDSVVSYKDKHTKICFGLVPNPAVEHERAETARRLKQKVYMMQKMGHEASPAMMKEMHLQGLTHIMPKHMHVPHLHFNLPGHKKKEKPQEIAESASEQSKNETV